MLHDREKSSVGELCRRVHTRNPTTQVSDWYMLFNGIYQLYEGKGGQPQPKAAVYTVTSDDLGAIKVATGGMGGYGLPNPFDVDLYRATFGAYRHSKSAPSGLPIFQTLLDTVALGYKRR